MMFENRYGFLDRILHRFAFATSAGQAALADVEDLLYSSRLAEIEVSQPVFVTALPRAGTTVLLNLIAALREFGSHTYRDMPFLVCPMLWSRFSARFMRSEAPRQRAHGDGLLVSTDSPEAFEEVLWKLFWPRHYRADRIEPWPALDDDQFRSFLLNHMKKIALLRCSQHAGKRRYVSKNNLNIARVPALADLMPSASILIPFRDPLQQAASMLRQHLRFLEIHASDRFAKAYMAAVGHFDFGANLKPIDFTGWLDDRRCQDATTPGFWLEYWVAAYRHLLEQHGEERIHFLSYDSLSHRPAESLARLAETLDVEDSARFCAQADTLQPAKPHDVPTHSIPADLLEEATTLYVRLHAVSILGSAAPRSRAAA